MHTSPYVGGQYLHPSVQIASVGSQDWNNQHNWPTANLGVESWGQYIPDMTMLGQIIGPAFYTF